MEGLPKYTIRESRKAKRVLLKIKPGKGLEVVLPQGVGRDRAKQAVAGKLDWIERTFRRMEADGVVFSDSPPKPPQTIELRAEGKTYRVAYIQADCQIRITENAGLIMVKGDQNICNNWTSELKKLIRQKASLHLPPQLRGLASELGMECGRITVRSQKTRWGSCSVKGDINLNCKLMFLPPRLVDQVLVHELCHTVHLNHSKKFWSLVAKFRPDYAEPEKALTKAGRMVPDWMA